MFLKNLGEKSVSIHAAVWSILGWAAIGWDKELMQSAHPSSRSCFTVSTGLAGLDGNTPSAWHTKQGRPHRGNKQRSINTLVLLRGESCRWPSLPVNLLFNRRGGEGGVLFANPPRRAHPSPRCCCRNVSSLLCLSGVCLHLSAASKQADTSPHLHYKSDKQWHASCQTRGRTKGEDSVT